MTMKKTFFYLLLTVMGAATMSAQTGTINIQVDADSNTVVYTIDTLESYQVGPGIVYTRFDITNSTSTRHCYIYDVDLTNPYNRVEETHSPTIGNTELLATTYTRLDAEGHRSIGGVNCNFWETTATEGLLGVACTGQVSNGKIGASITNWGLGVAASMGLGEEDQKQELGFLMLDTDGKAWIDQYSWNSKVRIGSTSKKLREANRNRNNPNENEIVLFNSDLGTKTTRSVDDLYEVVLNITGPWAINKEMHGVVVSSNTTGGTLIGENQAVLQARGDRKAFLQQAAVGDTIHFTIGIYSAWTEEYPSIAQLTAGNCLVMKDYRLRFRNWAEAYNNRNYPRTGFGVSADHQRLWMMVMEKPGMFTHEMCSILRHFGASYAMGADGGGSAQFNLGGRILNPTTEGTPRAVSNGVFLFSTAPDDAVVTEMRTKSTTLRLPRYGVVRPAFLGYNQYGMLVNKDLPGVVLTCSPEAGYMTDDGRFVCTGNGTLTARYESAELTMRVEMTDHADLTLRLDSILISDDTQYPIEITATVDRNEIAILPAALTWEVEDESVCSVSADGILTGRANGRTVITGTLGESRVQQIVRVEVPTSRPYRWETMVGIDQRWNVKPSSTAWNTAFMTDAQGKAVLYLNYTGGRQANIKLTADTCLYATPKQMELRFTPQGELIQKVSIGLRANNGVNTLNYATTDLVPDRENSIVIDLDSLFGTSNDMAIYPVRLEFITLSFSTSAEKREYNIPFDGIWLHYAPVTTDIDKVFTQQETNNTTARKVLIDGQIYILRNQHIYTLTGNERH